MIEFIENKYDWDRVIESFPDADTYHTYAYHNLSRDFNYRAVLMHYQEDDWAIAFPLLFRPVDGTEFWDVTSVYGYPGPLQRGNPDSLRNFHQVMQQSCQSQRVISAFSRLNPYLPYQENLLSPVGETRSLGEVVYIDLTLPEEKQLRQYNRRLRTYINKCKRSYLIRGAQSESDIHAFREIYLETMERVGARDHYFFNQNYFDSLMDAPDFDKEIWLAEEKENGCIAAGALFLDKGDKMHYHLSGVREQYLKLNPVKMLIDHARELGVKKNADFLNLGGGVGNRKDSLYFFKSGYSKETREFKVWRYICNETVYQELTAKKLASLGDKEYDREFFPLYRCDEASRTINIMNIKSTDKR